MRLLSDVRQLKKFLKDGSECPSEIIIEHYIDCKRDNVEIPKRVDDFITSCLNKILQRYNEGLKPDYDDIFGLKFAKGAKGKRKATSLKKVLQTGFLLSDYMSAGLTYELAVIKIAESRGVSVDTVKKAITDYNKIPDGIDHEPSDPPP